MSYCRFGWDDSDVYVIRHVYGYYMCYCAEMYHSPIAQEMADHLKTAHLDRGQIVPEDVIPSILQDGDIKMNEETV